MATWAPPPRPRWLPSPDQLHTLLHLTAWCQIGVLLRIQLDNLFGGACKGGEHEWVPCITSAVGALPNDLPPNAIGAFIMGLLASSDVLAKHLGHSLRASTPLAVLPIGSSLQVRPAAGPARALVLQHGGLQQAPQRAALQLCPTSPACPYPAGTSCGCRRAARVCSRPPPPCMLCPSCAPLCPLGLKRRPPAERPPLNPTDRPTPHFRSGCAPGCAARSPRSPAGCCRWW
jgi:hypothetical protein